MQNKIFAGCDSAGLFDLYEHTDNKHDFLLSVRQFRDMKTKNLRIKKAQKHAEHFLKIALKKEPKKGAFSRGQIAKALIESATESACKNGLPAKDYRAFITSKCGKDFLEIVCTKLGYQEALG